METIPKLFWKRLERMNLNEVRFISGVDCNYYFLLIKPRGIKGMSRKITDN